MKLLIQILTSLTLAAVLFFSFIIGGAPLMEGKHPINPYIDTYFAENYSPEKFDLIKLGMKRIQVVKLIGKPLHIGSGYYDSIPINYHYTGDGKLHKTNDTYKPGYDFAWYRSTIGFNDTGLVVYIDKGWSYD